MNAIPSELLEMLVRGGLLLSAAVLVSFTLRGRGAAMMSAYWRCAILAVLLLPLVPTLWTLRQSIADVPVRLVMETPAEAARPTTAAAVLAPSTAAPATIGEVTPGTAPGLPARLAEEVIAPGIVASPPVPAAVESAAGPHWFNVGLLALWALGALGVFGRWLLAASRFRRLWRQAVPAGDASLQRQFRELAGELGLRRPPSLMTHPEIAVPMAGGLLRPRVLLPNDCAHWATEERRMVLLHELVHVKRRDALFHLLASVAKALHWPNPLAWIAVRQMRSVAERATDDRVLEGGSDCPQYARLLVEFASRQMSAPSPAAPAAASSMAKPDTVEARVRRILDSAQRRTRPGWLAVTCLWASFAGLLALAGGVALAADDDDDDGDDQGGGSDRPGVTAAEKASQSASTLEEKLAEIVFPEIDFSEATLAEAIEYCSLRSRELDPAGRGINMIATPYHPPFDQPEAVQPTIGLRLQKIPLGELLRYMARLSGRRLSIEPHSVVFRSGEGGGDELHHRSYQIEGAKIEQALASVEGSEGGPVEDPFGGGGVSFEPEPPTARDWLRMAGVEFPPGTTAYYEPISGRLLVRQTQPALEYIELLVDSLKGIEPKPTPGRGPLRERMAKTVIPLIEFSDATLDEAVDFLRFQSEELSPGGRINLIVVPPSGREIPQQPRPITLQLKEIPFDAALRYIAEFSRYQVHVDPYAVVLTPYSSSFGYRIEVASFPIANAELRRRLAARPGAAREWLENLGIDCPDFASAYFEPVGNNLIVRNESTRIGLVDATLRRIEKATPDDGDQADADGATVEKQLEGPLAEDARLAACDTVVRFHQASTVADKLAFVRDSKRVKPLMESWYAEHSPMLDLSGKDDLTFDNPLAKQLVDRGRQFVVIAIDIASSGTRVYALEKTSEGLKLDWETAVGYQPMPVAEFKKKRPTEPVEFRVKVSPSGYYNYHFSDEEKFRAVELSYPGRPEVRFVGYIDRGAGWAKSLLADLEAGLAPSLIVKLRYPEGEIEDDSQVHVDAIVSATWWP